MKNPFSLTDKTILITGASSGIGRQCAISCSQMGANIILFARDEDRLKETLDQLEEGDHLYYAFDITKYDEIEQKIVEAVSKIGKISGFIHSAGIEMTLPLPVMKSQEYEKMFAVNTISAFETARLLSKKKYLSSNAASFVFISSIMGTVGSPAQIAYSASKGALLAGSRSMSVELARKNIRVNTISPGYIQTKMWEEIKGKLTDKEFRRISKPYLLGLGEPSDVANACIYFLSDASKWVTGTNFIIDGGFCAQ